MITFNLKKEWFEKIKSGGKTHEYREVKPYWTKRFVNLSENIFFCAPYGRFCYINQIGKCVDELKEECFLVCGYPKKDDKDKRLKARIKNICIVNGLETDLKINKDVYDIEFELIRSENVLKE